MAGTCDGRPARSTAAARARAIAAAAGLAVALVGCSLAGCGEGTTRPAPGSVLDVDVPVDCDDPSFSGTVEPLLLARCSACHRSSAPLGGLSMADHGSLLAGGNSGPAVMPWDCPGSLLYLMAAGLAQPSMPPTGYPRLSDSELACICAWIEDGAPDD